MQIILNILTHGGETVGLKVAREIKKLKLKNGHVVLQIANKLAYRKRKRFIDQDLNRSFPGNPRGNHEQRLAAKIAPITRKADLVIDIHSTKSGLKDALIITKLNKKTREYIEVIAPKYLLYMRATKDNSLISNARVGIAFEYGKNNDKKALKNIIAGIRKLFVHLGMLAGTRSGRNPRTIWMDVYGTVPKPKGAHLAANCRNYKLVKKGSVFAYHKGEPLIATESFYPILFGEKSYKDIFGFRARQLT